MEPQFTYDYLPLLPEIFLVLSGMLFMILGVFQGNKWMRTLSWGASAVFFITIIMVHLTPIEKSLVLNGFFVVDSFAIFGKTILLTGAFIASMLAMHYFTAEQEERFEYPVLLIFAAFGMMIMVSVNDLITMYIGIELQSLCLYVMAAFRRDALKSTEAGLKYFMLGAFSSAILLYGASLIYGFCGSTNFSALSDFFSGATMKYPPIGVMMGMIMVVVGLSFKIAAVPFHMWAPDVYEGSPTAVTAFFAIGPKIAGVLLLLRVLMGPFGTLVGHWQNVVVIMSMLSLMVGALGALQQNNLKRLMAYSSIGHTGFLLLGIASGIGMGIKAILTYLCIYLVMVAGIFALILSLRNEGKFIQTIDDLAGLNQSHPRYAAAFGILMFSMAGIPPLAGFFAKFYILIAALEANLVWAAVIAVLSSVISAFYYLRIVKLMYFDEPTFMARLAPGHTVIWILVASSGVTMLFFLIPGWIMSMASTAAQSLVSL